MNLDRIIRCLVIGKPEAAGSHIGHCLRKITIDELVEARCNLIRFNGPNKYTEGYVAALQDILAAFQTEMEAEPLMAETNLATATKVESIQTIEKLIDQELPTIYLP